MELVPKLIDYALKRATFGCLTFGCLGFGTDSSSALAVFQAFSLAKPRNLRRAFPKLKFWKSLMYRGLHAI
jgi:hypothetical protein